jgi:hypothetical protein
MIQDHLSHTQPQQTAPPEQAAEVNVAACSKCGADVRKTGFYEIVTTYQGYERSAGKLVKSYRKNSTFRYIECALCRERLDTTIETLIGEKAV